MAVPEGEWEGEWDDDGLPSNMEVDDDDDEEEEEEDKDDISKLGGVSGEGLGVTKADGES